MPKMKARIQVTYDIPLDTDVPDAEFEEMADKDAQGNDLPKSRRPLAMSNEGAVEKARRRAAKDAEARAKTFKDEKNVVDAYVVEVTEE